MADPHIIKSNFRVEGMDCPTCSAKIETALGRLSGIKSINVSYTSGALKVFHDEALGADAIKNQVIALGFKIKEQQIEAHLHDHGNEAGPWWKTHKAIMTMVCAASLAIAYAVSLLYPAVENEAYAGALVVGLFPIARRAFEGAKAGSLFSIETLMTIAAVGAFIIGATSEAAMVVLLFLVGELLEGVAARRAQSSIRSLATLIPKQAFIEENGKTYEIGAEKLTVGQIILVRPGDRIPADGEIIEGSSSINEAPVTGESASVHKTAGDKVFAGTISTDGVLRIRVTATAADNTIARIIKLVEEAQESKAPTQRFIDRFSSYYTPFVLVVGALVATVPPLLFGAAWNEWLYKGLAILLIGCPCALVISTPAAIAAGLSAGARRGLLLKGGAVLEELRRVTHVALDKTGTLTEGKPVVTDIVGLSDNQSSVLSLAAALEAGSSHPLALAILAKAKADKVTILPATNAQAIAGKGVSGTVNGQKILLLSPKAAWETIKPTFDQKEKITALNNEGKTVSVLFADNRITGLIAIRDEPREDAIRGLAALKQANIQTLMLTGDNHLTAQAIGRNLGVNDVHAELMPEDKQLIVQKLQSKGAIVAKVGDGINDAPALAAADIGIAMGGGTDVALETADAAILHGRVLDIANMVSLSKKVMGNIQQNITIALGLKAVFLVTTILGITGLWPAILADTGATVLVTANAMRLLRWQGN